MATARSRLARQQLRSLLRDHPVVAGSLVEQYVTCGKPACRCARGEKHGPLYYLYWKEQGRSHSLYVPRDEVDGLRAQLDTNRQFHAELLAGADRQRRAWQRRFKKGRPR
jgi:hypothetical protein